MNWPQVQPWTLTITNGAEEETVEIYAESSTYFYGNWGARWPRPEWYVKKDANS